LESFNRRSSTILAETIKIYARCARNSMVNKRNSAIANAIMKGVATRRGATRRKYRLCRMAPYKSQLAIARAIFVQGSGRHSKSARCIDRQDQSGDVEEKNKRRGKRAHQRQPISRPNQHINKRNRPSEENQHFEQVCNRATAEGVSTEGQERSLQDESQRD